MGQFINKSELIGHTSPKNSTRRNALPPIMERTSTFTRILEQDVFSKKAKAVAKLTSSVLSLSSSETDTSKEDEESATDREKEDKKESYAARAGLSA